jgi:hypothetical protein
MVVASLVSLTGSVAGVAVGCFLEEVAVVDVPFAALRGDFSTFLLLEDRGEGIRRREGEHYLLYKARAKAIFVVLPA